MARALRLQYPGSLWHITSRGNDKRATFLDDNDRHKFLELLGYGVSRFRWILFAYVLMGNHYHLFLQLTDETLSRGMQWLNGKYTKFFNWRHDRVGHLFQGPFKSILVEKETYFLELLRYVVLNPVRARLVARPETWQWSSHRAILGELQPPDWLAVDDVLVAFAPEANAARSLYRTFVTEGITSGRNPFDDVIADVFLGSKQWAASLVEKVDLKPRADAHPLRQRRIGRPAMVDVVKAVARTLRVDSDIVRSRRGGDGRMLAAWVGANEGLLTNTEIAAGLRLRSSGHVTYLLKRCEATLGKDEILRAQIDDCISTLRRPNRKSKL